MVESWLYPLKITDTRLDRVSFNVLDRARDDDAPTIRISVGDRYEDGDRCSCDLMLYVEYECAHEGRPCVIDCDWFIAVEGMRGPYMDALTDEEKKRVVEANTISLAYGEVRAFVEEMTSRTAVGRITLPCIGPYQLLDSVNEAEN